MMPNRLLRCLIPALSLVLAACAAVTGAREAPRLFTLTPAESFEPGLPEVNRQLLIETPIAPAGLDTTRIALRTGRTSLDYFADVNWADRAPAMLERLIVGSFENTDKIIGVGRSAAGLRADFLLRPELRDFQAEYEGAPGLAAPVINVALNAKLISVDRREIVASEVFQAQVEAKDQSMTAIIDAWDQAVEQALNAMTAWTLRQLAGAGPSSGVSG